MAIATMHPYLVQWYLICNYIVEREVSMRRSTEWFERLGIVG